MKDFLKWLGRLTPPGFLLNNLKWASNKLFGSNFSNTWDDLYNGLANFASGSSDSVVDNFIGSMSGKYAGTNLTGAEREQNEYTAMREDTRYQRSVQDMQAAGLNPALLYGSGSSAPAVNSSAGGVAGSGSLSDFLALAMLPLQMKSAKADIKKTIADTKATEVQTAGQQISNSWLDLLNESEVASRNARANVDNAQASVVVHKAQAEITSLLESAKSESYRRTLMSAQSFLAEANADKVYALLPFEQALMEAQADYENASTQFTLVQKLYQQKLINSGYIESVIRSANANATVDEVEAWLSSDQFGRENESKFERVMHSIVSGLNTAVKIVSPIKSSRSSSVEVNKTTNSNVNIHKSYN